MLNNLTSICVHPDCDFEGQSQSSENFTKNKNRKNGLNAWCKICRSRVNQLNKPKWQAYNKIYKQTHKDEIKKYEDEIYKEKRQQLYKNWKHKKSYFDTFSERISKYGEETRQDPNDSKLLQVKCNFCKNWFNPTNSEIQNRLSSIEKENKYGESRLYCSQDCKIKCPVYKTINNPKNKPNNVYRPDQNELRNIVLERDEYSCVRCGKKDKNLICHHITGVMQNPIESADIDNCVTLCIDCDNYIHSQSGCRRIDLRCKN